MISNKAELNVPMKKILFLCTGNYYRSRFAEEFFNYHIAYRNGQSYQAFSRGLARDIDALRNPGPISKHALEKLDELNIPPERSEEYPVSAQASDFHEADEIIALCKREHRPMMESRFPEFADNITYWEIEDVQWEEPKQAMNQLVERLNRFMKRF